MGPCLHEPLEALIGEVVALIEEGLTCSEINDLLRWTRLQTREQRRRCRAMAASAGLSIIVQEIPGVWVIVDSPAAVAFVVTVDDDWVVHSDVLQYGSMSLCYGAISV